MAEYCEYCMQPVDGAGSCPFCGNSVRWNANDNWQLQPGTILQGRYLLGRVLGSGGFGVTYIGRDLRLNRRIAVKEYFPKACANRISASSPVVTITDDQSYFAQKGKASFIQEAQALATLPRNLGVVEVYDYFENNGTAYIVMEYLEGSTLKQLLQYRRFGADELFYLLEPVLEALELVHRSKLVHRDISPDNLMLCGDGKLVLMDFGAARQVNLDNPLSMTLVVKRGYAPEEQYRTRGEVGPWTDIYALCATIYHCLTGIVPEESVERLVYDTIQWPSELGIAITQRQESVLKKGMAVHARDRYRSVGALRKALSGQGKAETVTSPVQPPVNRTMPEVNQMKSSWQQAGVHRMPETQTASETWEARPSVAVGEMPQVYPMVNFDQSYVMAENPENPEKPGKSGKLIALVVAVALVLCIGLGAVGLYLSDSPAKKLANAEVGSTVFFGTYEQDNDSSNGAEEIEWLVLDRDGDNVLLLSKYALDTMLYNEEWVGVTWETCTLRSWLNDAFYTTAFSSEEQRLIKTTTVTADSNPEYDIFPGNDTKDKVFLLSISEAEKYFTSDEARMCGTTDYAITNGAWTNDSYTVGGKATCWWWLRSPGSDSDDAADVDGAGSVSTYGRGVRRDGLGIRPALWVNLAS